MKKVNSLEVLEHQKHFVSSRDMEKLYTGLRFSCKPEEDDEDELVMICKI